MYSTPIFTNIFEDADTFLTEYKASPFYNAGGSSTLTDDSITLTYYLLYNRYGNSPIANLDQNQFKFKVFGTIMQFGPSWQTKLDIQAKARSLGVDDSSEIYKGSKAIYNHAYNPETAPATSDTEELDYINDQNTTSYKKSKLEGLATLSEVIRDDVTSSYIDKFRKLFKQMLFPICFPIFVTEEEES